MKRILLMVVFCFLAGNGFGDSPYPNSVSIKCEKLDVRLDANKFWNINGVKYNNLSASVDLAGAHWGTVFEFPEIGFIGSGHNDIELEQVLDIKMFTDGKYASAEEVDKGGGIRCSEFRMTKTSKVKDISFNYVLEIKNNQLTESCQLTANKDIQLNRMYNFMHPWSEEMTDYHIMIAKDKTKQGEFKTDDTFPYDGNFIWVALYNKKNHVGVVSKFTGDTANLLLWDRKQYKKTYLSSFVKSTFVAGQIANYKMITAFFVAPPDEWLKIAEETASQL